jgi:C4-type Zn-finger protein
MRLSESLKRQILGWFASKAPAGQGECPVCHQANWKLQDTLVCIPMTAESQSLAIPFVSFACEQCGHARLFFAKMIGLDV